MRMSNERRLLIAVWTITIVLGAVSYGVFKTRRGDWFAFWQHQPLGAVTADAGASFTTTTGRPDLIESGPVSPLQILEDGRLLFPPNAPLDDIRGAGNGRFRVDGETVFFSSTDGSDPRTSGRRYSFAYPPVGRPASRALYAVTLLFGGLTFLLSAWALRAAETRQVIWRTLRDLPGTTRQLYYTTSERSGAILHQRVGSNGGWWVTGVWVLAALLLASSQTVFLMRTGQWTSLWREAAIGEAAPEIGHAFVARTGRETLSSHQYPSSAAMFEDGRPLGLRNAIHQEIRTVGMGRYSFWYDYVYFSASDNTDPRTNGRRYTISFAPVSRTAARWLYVCAALWFAGALAFTALVARAGLLGAGGTRTLLMVRRYSAPLIVAAAAGGLVAIGFARATPALAGLVSALWPPVLVLNGAAAVICAINFGRSLPRWTYAVMLTGLAGGYLFLTVWAPHRTQGCHTEGVPYALWTAYCVAPDSASYYIGYTVGSTRQPLYPWFIDAVTSGTEFNRRQYVDTLKPGAPRFADDPLFRVVRAQMVLLLAAAIAACGAAMLMLGSPFPAVFFLWMYDMQFFSANELNIVLTEPLVQTFVMLLTAAYLAFLGRRRPLLLLAAGAACGLAYLTRQAAVYGAVMLGFLILVALVSDWRRWWHWSVASLAIFVALALIPDVYAFAQTGKWGQQTQLQYQYRIAHAMQYATPLDVELMPDEESRAWLADAIVRRDVAHRKVALQFKDDELNRMIYSIAANLYEVATPVAPFTGEMKTPEFYMKVATPILQRHWKEYLAFSFRFWQFGIDRPGLALLAMFDISTWYLYLVMGGLIVYLRSERALAAGAMIMAHWGAVAIICLAAVPIPRMINASEFLVVVAAVILAYDMTGRIVSKMPVFGKGLA